MRLCAAAPGQHNAEQAIYTVQTHLDQVGSGGKAVAHEDPVGRGLHDAVKVLWCGGKSDRISVIVPTLDRADMIFALVSSLRRHTAAWDRLEIIVMINGRLEPQSEFAFSEIDKMFDCIRIVPREVEFNWGEINNATVREHSTGDIIIFLNDDMACVTHHWDDLIRGQLARSGIGVVGGRLLYPNGMIQHAGITFCSEGGATAHEAMGDPADDGLYLDRTLLVHEIGAVTGAFLACRRTLFDEMGGFDALRYAITSSDADFCVRVRASGKRIIYDPFLTWIHYESVSRGSNAHDYRKHWRAEAEHERWRKNFAEVELVDPSFNPQLNCSARPFETFHRAIHAEIRLWLDAQLRRGKLRSRPVPPTMLSHN